VQIKAKLRSGSEYILILEGETADTATIFADLVAGRSQALRGWVRVHAHDEDVSETVVLGAEIVELQLIDDAAH